MMPLLGKIWKNFQLPKQWQLEVMRLFQDQFLVGVLGVILNDKDEILLFKHTYRTNAWSLPGGYLKAKEKPNIGLEREIEEESGLIVSADKRFKIRTDQDTARLEIIYTGSFIGGDFQPSTEVTEARFFSFDTLPQIRKDQLLIIDKILRQKGINGHSSFKPNFFNFLH